MNPETLRQFIEIFHAEQDRQAERKFDEAFAAMQAEFQPVKKSRTVHNKAGEKMYNYAAIEDLQKQFGPTIAKHGFSYSFRDSAVPDAKDWRRVTLRISGHGAFRESSFDMPPVSGTSLMSAQQCLGAQNTYARRYAFISGFGLVVEGEDNDAAPGDSRPVDIEKLKARCRAARTHDELNAVYRVIRAETGNQKSINDALIPVCIARKRELEEAPVY